MRGRAASSLALALMLLVSACQYDPYTAKYATDRPDVRDIVGTWTATDATLQGLGKTPYSQARPVIDVQPDGSIEMRDIPDTWRAADSSSGKLETFTGTWELAKSQAQWWGLDLRRGDWGCYGCLMVLGDEALYKLVLRYGDPDAGFGYEFRRAG